MLAIIFIITVLSLGMPEEGVLKWSDSSGFASCVFRKRDWDYSESENGIILSHTKWSGTQVSLSIQKSTPSTQNFYDLARDVLTRKGSRVRATIINEDVLDKTLMRQFNATDGYYCEGVFGPDIEPISIRVYVLYRNSHLLIIETKVPGTEKINEYSHRKGADAIEAVLGSTRINS